MNNLSNQNTKQKTAYLTRKDCMINITYENSHENENLPDNSDRQGKGLNHCTWIVPESNLDKSSLNQGSNISGIVESYLEPFASIGWHTHLDTEEAYYILDGELTVEYEDNDKNHYKDTLFKGDLHRIYVGMSHCAKAGSNGCKFIAFIVR